MQTASSHLSSHPEVAPGDRDGIVDALYRFGAGQDLRDRALFESAFSPEATLDFTAPARRLGATIPVFEGRRAIADTVFSTIGGLDTTHTVTNPRVTAYDGDHASLFALVEAQHLPRNDHSRHLLLKNIYTLELSRTDDQWVIDHMKIDTVWMTGDPSVLFPASAG
ncbi:MAG TPA: nuclear transport factor 2 family protein [Gemmatimonadaceae bacterium]